MIGPVSITTVMSVSRTVASDAGAGHQLASWEEGKAWAAFNRILIATQLGDGLGINASKLPAKRKSNPNTSVSGAPVRTTNEAGEASNLARFAGRLFTLFTMLETIENYSLGQPK